MKTTTAASLGLFAAWALHDVEELATMSHTSGGTLSRMPAWVPIGSDLRTQGVSQTHVNVSIAIMGAVVATAALAGARTGGRSPWFRGALQGFGLHGCSHLGASAVTRGYTTGVATSPAIVIPYWLWARRALRRHGIRDIDARSTAVALLTVPVMFTVHALTRAVLGPRSVRTSTGGPSPHRHGRAACPRSQSSSGRKSRRFQAPGSSNSP